MTAIAAPGPHPAVQELLSRDAWPRERLLAYQQERLRELVSSAVAGSPYYREALGPYAADAPLAELPTLSKATLMERFDDVVTDRRLRLADALAFVATAEPGALHRGRYHVFATSGSTGEPGLFVYSDDEFAQWAAVGLACFARHGVTGETRLAAIGAPAEAHVTRRLFAAFVAGRERAPRLDVTMPIGDLVDALNRYQSEAIASYASVLGVLAEEQLQGRLSISPRVTVVGSEVLTDETSRLVELAWGRPPVNVYAATEATTIACGRPDCGGMRVCEDVLVLEVVDESGRPVPPGIPGAKVLLTNLVNRVQPLIRYELSDSVVLADGPELRLARVDGRSDDTLELAAADGGVVRVSPFRLRAPLSTLVDVLQYQIVHERDGGLRVSVIPRGVPARDLLDRVRLALVQALEEAGAAPPRVRVEVVAEIAREPGPAAKLKLVRSEP
jgi:phenylacetate-coenzyme A ligase PaaK-like adenylate-forming protein